MPKEAVDDLAARQFTAIGGEGLAAQQQDADSEQAEAAAFAQLEAGAQKIILGALKAVRGIIARKLPEIREEWSDATLSGPAEAAIPLIKKYLPGIMDKLGQNPELGMFAFSLLPLILGYVEAVERHGKTVSDVTAKPDGDQS